MAYLTNANCAMVQLRRPEQHQQTCEIQVHIWTIVDRLETSQCILEPFLTFSIHFSRARSSDEALRSCVNDRSYLLSQTVHGLDSTVGDRISRAMETASLCSHQESPSIRSLRCQALFPAHASFVSGYTRPLHGKEKRISPSTKMNQRGRDATEL